jgi:hypothetical protein
MTPAAGGAEAPIATMPLRSRRVQFSAADVRSALLVAQQRLDERRPRS